MRSGYLRILLLFASTVVIFANDWEGNGENGFGLCYFWVGTDLTATFGSQWPSIGKPKFKLCKDSDGGTLQIGLDDNYVKIMYSDKLKPKIESKILGFKADMKYNITSWRPDGPNFEAEISIQNEGTEYKMYKPEHRPYGRYDPKVPRRLADIHGVPIGGGKLKVKFERPMEGHGSKDPYNIDVTFDTNDLMKLYLSSFINYTNPTDGGLTWAGNTQKASYNLPYDYFHPSPIVYHCSEIHTYDTLLDAQMACIYNAKCVYVLKRETEATQWSLCSDDMVDSNERNYHLRSFVYKKKQGNFSIAVAEFREMGANLKISLTPYNWTKSTIGLNSYMKGDRKTGDNRAIAATYNQSTSISILKLKEYSDSGKQMIFAAKWNMLEENTFGTNDTNLDSAHNKRFQKAVVIDGMWNGELQKSEKRFAVIKATDADTDRSIGRIQLRKPDHNTRRLELFWSGKQITALNVHQTPGGIMKITTEDIETDAACDIRDEPQPHNGYSTDCRVKRIIDVVAKDETLAINLYQDLFYKETLLGRAFSKEIDAWKKLHNETHGLQILDGTLIGSKFVAKNGRVEGNITFGFLGHRITHLKTLIDNDGQNTFIDLALVYTPNFFSKLHNKFGPRAHLYTLYNDPEVEEKISVEIKPATNEGNVGILEEVDSLEINPAINGSVYEEFIEEYNNGSYLEYEEPYAEPSYLELKKEVVLERKINHNMKITFNHNNTRNMTTSFDGWFDMTQKIRRATERLSNDLQRYISNFRNPKYPI